MSDSTTPCTFGLNVAHRPWLRHLRVCDWFFLVYLVATGLLVAVRWPAVEYPTAMLLLRALAVAIIMVSVRRAAETRAWGWRLVRDLYMPWVMGWLYVETGTLNKLIIHDPIDQLLAIADHAIFGYQPALEFYYAFSHPLISEFLNFSYFSYYMIFLGSWVLLWFRRQRASQFFYQEYLFLTALVMVPCYFWYVAVPTWGPQYVFAEHHSRDNFTGYLFKWALDFILHTGERPTGAFPSSHTALSVAVLFLLWRRHRPTFWVAIVPFTGLWISTVYIQAHFFVDIVAGVAVGALAGVMYPRLQRKWQDRGMAEEILPRDDDPVVRNEVGLNIRTEPGG